MTADGVVLGYSHLGMLAAARWLMSSVKGTLIEALQDNPGYSLKVVGECLYITGTYVFFIYISTACESGILQFQGGEGVQFGVRSKALRDCGVAWLLVPSRWLICNIKGAGE